MTRKLTIADFRLPILLVALSVVPTLGGIVRWPGLHRRAGRVLAVCGLLAAGSGFWMTAFYPIPTGLQGPLLRVVRLAVASAMLTSIIIAWSSAMRRQIARHETFMIRAYALAQGAGTQVIVLLPWMLISGESEGLTRDLLMTLSWTINIALAEWIIGRRRRGTAPLVSSALFLDDRTNQITETPVAITRNQT
jgi:hypothetical protein